MKTLISSLVAVLALLTAAPAAAFCGFYVAPEGGSLVNDATQVVMMRYADTTVQSMQNNYKGPAQDFAMVVPVPQVLQRENVKTLPKDAFDKIDRLTSPRLVEYWEQDPCRARGWDEPPAELTSSVTTDVESVSERRVRKAVKVEAKFSVGEYDIVVLSATESTALDTWLRQNGYNIPDGAEPYLAPYVESGMYFFVARVDIDRAETKPDGTVVLSPLRFHYENDSFFLPVRLGMINSAGSQDLIVYTLAEGFRFEVANRPNVFIPTNVEVKDEVRDNFVGFYEALFETTRKSKPGAVITEYAWSSAKCDPCPGPTLDQEDILTFGADVVTENIAPATWVVTRLHARHDAGEVGEDLVFAKAPPIVGGLEVRTEDGALARGARIDASPHGRNAFQGRYIIRHEWQGDANCEDPRFGVWGGPPGGGTAGLSAAPSANSRSTSGSVPVSDVASLVKNPIDVGRVVPAREVELPKPARKRGACAGCAHAQASSLWWFGVIGMFLAFGRRFSRRGSMK